jgi:hypothetical protein
MRNLILLALALAACTKTVPSPGGLGEPCVANGDCTSGFLCAAGRCVLPANLGGCEAGRLRCNGADVEKCGANGLGWDLVSSCATGCSAGACRPQVCTPGTTRCDGNASEQCTPAGDAWALVQICPSLCAADTGLCRAPVCTPFSTRCEATDGSLSQICDSYGASWLNLPCGAGKVCDGGRCLDVVCKAGVDTRCSSNGGSVESCNAKGDGWVASQSCSIRCAVTGSTAACLSPVCSAGALRCSPTVASALEQCLPDRSAWGFVTFCATGCSSSGSGTAACAPPVCAPFSRRCTSSGGGVETCKADGTGWAQTDTCPQGCAGGNCTTTSAGCSPGDLRCNGVNAQSCTQVSPGITQWNTVAACLAGCSSGACAPGGSCAGVTLHAAAASAPGDGISTVLVYSDVIAGVSGAPIPDGQAFQVAISPQGTVVGGGVVRSFAGRIHFKVLAPALSFSGPDVAATVTAQLAVSSFCTASTPITFTAAASPTVLVAEDFTNPNLRNLAVANAANWDATRGALIASWPSSVGAGEDGPLPVTGTMLVPRAPAFGVISLAGTTANLDGIASGLNSGDEVVLWDAQGSSSGTSNAGSYEVLHIAGTNGGSQVTFVETPALMYGAANDNDVALQHVILQRVPHFSSITIAPGAVLTAPAWDGTKGGLIFVRVSGTTKIQGELKMDAAGYRGGKANTTPPYFGEDMSGFPSAGAFGAGYYWGGGGYGTAGGGTSPGIPGVSYGLPLLGKLFFGSGGGPGSTPQGGAGGGVIVLAAQAVTLMADTGGTQQGRIHADGQMSPNTNSGSGAGGSVWISAPSIALGTGAAGAISAQGGAPNGTGAGGAGRVRVDLLGDPTALGSGCLRSLPACNFGVAGPLVGQSLDEYALSSGSLAIRSASLLLALGAPANAAYFAAASSIDPPDFGAVPSSAPLTVTFSSSGSPAIGPRFRWKTLLSPPPGAPQALLGLQWSLTVN